MNNTTVLENLLDPLVIIVVILMTGIGLYLLNKYQQRDINGRQEL